MSIATPLIRTALQLPVQKPVDWTSADFIIAFLIGFAAIVCALVILLALATTLFEAWDAKRHPTETDTQ